MLLRLLFWTEVAQSFISGWEQSPIGFGRIRCGRSLGGYKIYLSPNNLVKGIAWCGIFLLASGLLQASGPVDIFEFSSEEQKLRYKSLIEEFRCPKCLNINIAGSDAPIAQDLRRTVHRLLVEKAMSDDEIREIGRASCRERV